jgi:NDP-sugar pyrophosphorylase family protein
MQPFTNNYQKSMIPVQGTPLLEYIVEGLKYAGFQDFIFVVGYLKEQVVNYFNNGTRFNINIEYVEQTELNGTGGALLLCEDLINEKHFFLTWGDILVPYHIYKKVYDTYRKEQNDFILVTNYQENLEKGCAIYCDGDFCIKMVEKPPKNVSDDTKLNNCGIFIFSKEIFEILKDINFSRRGELEIPDALSKGIQEDNWKVRIIKMKDGEFRGDFGDPAIYKKLNEKKSWLNDLKPSD